MQRQSAPLIAGLAGLLVFAVAPAALAARLPQGIEADPALAQHRAIGEQATEDNGIAAIYVRPALLGLRVDHVPADADTDFGLPTTVPMDDAAVHAWAPEATGIAGHGPTNGTGSEVSGASPDALSSKLREAFDSHTPNFVLPPSLVAALTSYRDIRRAAQRNPHPEELTVAPAMVVLPPLDATPVGSLPKGKGKSSVRLSPHHIAYLVQPARAIPPALPVAMPSPLPRLTGNFSRVRLLRTASVRDAASLISNDFVIRLVGYDLPEPDTACRRIDGVTEPCHLRIRTVLELLIRNRALVCHYEQPEAQGPAYGQCRAGSFDLADSIVARGYAKRSALAKITPEAPVAAEAPKPAAKAPPTPAARRGIASRPPREMAKAPHRVSRPGYSESWPMGPNGPKVISLRPATAKAARATSFEPLGPGGPRVYTIAGSPKQKKAERARTLSPRPLSGPRFVPFTIVSR